jgi:hypothetical protein
MMCVHMFIGMSAHIYIYKYIMFKKSMRHIWIAVYWETGQAAMNGQGQAVI